MTIKFEDWEAERMKDPEFRAAWERLEPAYQAERLRIIRALVQEALVRGEIVPYSVALVGMRGPTANEIRCGKELESLAMGCLARSTGLKKLASLAVEIAEELRDEGSVIDLGQMYGLSSLDLVLEGLSGDLAQGPLYDKVCDFNPNYAAAKEDMPIEQAADEIKEHVLPLRNWRSLAHKHGLKAVCLSIRRNVGAERRCLHTRRGNPELPGDPLIVF